MPGLAYLWAQFRHTWAKRGKSSAFRIEPAAAALRDVGKLEPGALVLSLGCRNRIEPDILEREGGWNVTAVDLFPMERGIQRADMHKLPFTDSSFSAVVASHVLEHAHDPDQALREVARVLRPNGLLWAAWPTGFVPTPHDRNDYGQPTEFALRFPRGNIVLWGAEHYRESRVLLRVR